MVTVLYPFSGDPITHGHIDIIERAARIYDQVVVGIGINISKSYVFSLEEREAMAKKHLSHLKNVSVVTYPGLLVHYAYENDIPLIVRGVRNGPDFDAEMELHYVGASQELGIETAFLPASQDKTHVSSSAVRELQRFHGLLHDYVPLDVKQSLEAKISGQYIVGVTGEICSGKSYVAERIAEIGRAGAIEVHNIDLDRIGHDILETRPEKRYARVRKEIVDTFGSGIGNGNGNIDRKALGEIVFSDMGALARLNKIMYTPMLVRLQQELCGKKGLILFNAALIAESDMGFFCNNNCILVHVDRDVQEARLKARGLEPDQIQRRVKSQYSEEQKHAKLQEAIEHAGQGHIWLYDNSGKDDGAMLRELFDDIADRSGILR